MNQITPEVIEAFRNEYLFLAIMFAAVAAGVAYLCYLLVDYHFKNKNYGTDAPLPELGVLLLAMLTLGMLAGATFNACKVVNTPYYVEEFFKAKK